MKITLASILAFVSLTATAQKDINLNLLHNFDGIPITYGQVYTNQMGTALSFDRIQYYLSGFEITYDGGQVLDMSDVYIIGSGNVSSYSLGNEILITVEGLNFDLGVDAVTNGLGTSSWPAGHPLSTQAPPMDWDWPFGYFYFVIDGLVDTNGDGIPNSPFSLRAVGESFLRDVNAFTGLSISDATIELAVDVNVADWLVNTDLGSVGILHAAGGPMLLQVADDTNDETVFTMSETLDIHDYELDQSEIYAYYEMAYAPTIFYNLATKSEVDVKVYNMNGQLQLESNGLNPEGNYFIRKELPSGKYIIVFANKEIEESFKFVVSQ
jgi:hypothetical protein